MKYGKNISKYDTLDFMLVFASSIAYIIVFVPLIESQVEKSRLALRHIIHFSYAKGSLIDDS